MPMIKEPPLLSKSRSTEPDDPLTPYEERFVHEFIIDLNKTQAALRADPSQSRSTASNSANYLTRKPNVRLAINQKLAQINGSLEDRARRVLQELTYISYSDARDLFNDSGRLHDIHDIPDHIAPAISSIEVVRKGDDEHIHKIRLWDKTKALGMLGRHLGVIKDVMEHTGPNGGPIQVQPVIDVAALPVWLKQALIVIIKGGSISADLEERLSREVGEKFIELEIVSREEGVQQRELEPSTKMVRPRLSTGRGFYFIKGKGCGPFEQPPLPPYPLESNLYR